MGDGSATELLAAYVTAKIIVEVEIGVVDGEQDRYLLTATFGKMPGGYKPGTVQRRPETGENGPAGGRAQAGAAR